jgi:hypothetical protein
MGNVGYVCKAFHVKEYISFQIYHCLICKVYQIVPDIVAYGLQPAVTFRDNRWQLNTDLSNASLLTLKIKFIHKELLFHSKIDIIVTVPEKVREQRRKEKLALEAD